jgi:CDP-glycerol glycerophosphotransferase (TagB/SpsB family)
MIRNFLHIAKSNLLLGTYYASKLWKRDKRTWCFVDDSNSFYLFLQLHNRINSPNCFLLVTDKHRANELCKIYSGVLYLYSFKALLIQLRASLIFLTHSMPSEISFSLMGGAIKFNLWHGIGIKNMGCINRNPSQDLWFKIPQNKRFRSVGFLNAYPDLLLASSPATAKWLSLCFGLPQDKLIISSYPRIDIINSRELDQFVSLPMNKHYTDLIEKIKNHKKSFLYMPTWRDSNKEFFSSLSFNLQELNEHMKSQGGLFIFKFHPYTKLPESCSGEYSNILFLSSNYDVYPWIYYIDTLITDYSSIYYEFILLGKEKEVILFPFDEFEYKNDKRGLYFDYDQDMPATRVYTFKELMSQLDRERKHLVPNRDRIIEKFWDYNHNFIDTMEQCNYEMSSLISDKSRLNQ